MFSQIVILGNIGSDPELRYTLSGQSVCNFSVATNRRWTNADGSPGEEVTWYRVSSWGKQAEAVSKHMQKGSSVLVLGRLRPDSSGNPAVFVRKDGTAGASYDVTADTVRFASPSNGRVLVEDGAVGIEEDEAPF